MRDKIIEILKKNTKQEYYITWCHEEPHSESKIIGFEKAADEILALPLYPKEFVEWINITKEDKYKWDWVVRKISTDELYEYYKNLPK